MKISSDPGMVSALETWLRDTGAPEAQAQASAGGLADPWASESTLPLPNSAMTAPRDSAEGLLELNVWNGVPDGSRQLASSALIQTRAAEPAGVIQGWTDHIFQPLV